MRKIKIASTVSAALTLLLFGLLFSTLLTNPQRPQEVLNTIAPHDTADVGTERLFLVTGDVRDPFDMPVPRASLLLLGPSLRLPMDATSDAAGRFELCRVPSGRYDLSVQSDRWGALHKEGLLLSSATVLKLRFDRLSSLSGKVMDPARAYPELCVEGPISMPQGVSPLRIPVPINKLDGSFHISGLCPGTFRIRESGDNRRVDIAFSIEKNGEETFLLIPMGEVLSEFLSGIAYLGDRNHPLRDANIAVHAIYMGVLHSMGVSTDIAGRFTLPTEGIGPGAELRFSRGPGFAFVSISYSGPSSSPVEVLFDNTPPLQLQLLSRDARPLPFAKAQVILQGNRQLSFARAADTQGTIMAGEVVPGEYRVVVRAGDGSSRAFSTELTVSSDEKRKVVSAVFNDISQFLGLRVSDRDGNVLGAYLYHISFDSGGALKDIWNRRWILGEDPAARRGDFVALDLPTHGTLIAEALCKKGWGRVVMPVDALADDAIISIVVEDPTRIDIMAYDAVGTPLADVVFSIPGFYDNFKFAANVAENGPSISRRSAVDLIKAKSGVVPGSYTLTVFDGDGAMLRARTSDARQVLIPGEKLVRERVLIFDDMRDN